MTNHAPHQFAAQTVAVRAGAKPAVPRIASGLISVWVMAARPGTLSLSMAPVITGAALAWTVERQIHWLAALVALTASASIQVATNLHNDAADSKRGADGPDRIGPQRATASGLLDEKTVNRAACTCFGVAAIMGVYLIWLGGWPILLLGTLSILAGWAYTGGPLPIAYTPLGELFVIAFFGVGALCGTYWLCTGTLTPVAFHSGVAVGCLTAAVLLVNNHRDVKEDARVGRKTLAISAGPLVTTWVYAGLMLVPFALLTAIEAAMPRGNAWLAFCALPFAGLLIYRFAQEPQGPSFNQILVQTVKVQLLFNLLLTMGLVL